MWWQGQCQLDKGNLSWCDDRVSVCYTNITISKAKLGKPLRRGRAQMGLPELWTWTELCQFQWNSLFNRLIIVEPFVSHFKDGASFKFTQHDTHPPRSHLILYIIQLCYRWSCFSIDEECKSGKKNWSQHWKAYDVKTPHICTLSTDNSHQTTLIFWFWTCPHLSHNYTCSCCTDNYTHSYCRNREADFQVHTKEGSGLPIIRAVSANHNITNNILNDKPWRGCSSFSFFFLLFFLMLIITSSSVNECSEVQILESVFLFFFPNPPPPLFFFFDLISFLHHFLLVGPYNF